MNRKLLEKYATLIVKMGVNVQKGQEVIINIGLENFDLLELLVEKCYEAGASRVEVEYDNPTLTKLHVKYRTLETLSHLTSVERAQQEKNVTVKPARIYIKSDDPDALKGIDQEKLSASRKILLPEIKFYRDQIEDDYQWCICTAPSIPWAKKVFPDVSDEEAVEKLWEAILFASRVDEETDPLENWKKHNDTLNEKSQYLNSLNLDHLIYKSSNGTDFKVSLIEDGLFVGGKETTKTLKIQYNPNIPSDEIFTSPFSGRCEGVVYSTKPLSYQGEIIDDFYLIFKNGEVVEVHAKRGEELLKKMISMDEGARKLGECALVPYETPINKLNITFFKTIFDENASCHLALGRGFSVIKDYEKYSEAELKEKGINESMIHVDFMIGSSDLSIVGVSRDGTKHQIFINGGWAF